MTAIKLNFDEEFIKYFNKKCKITVDKSGVMWFNDTNSFACCFGAVHTPLFIKQKSTPTEIKTKEDLKHFNYYNIRSSFLSHTDKCGIEILGLKAKRTKDGKYKYENVDVKTLKEACKQNGIKGYSKLDKLDLVKELMKI